MSSPGGAGGGCPCLPQATLRDPRGPPHTRRIPALTSCPGAGGVGVRTPQGKTPTGVPTPAWSRAPSRARSPSLPGTGGPFAPGPTPAPRTSFPAAAGPCRPGPALPSRGGALQQGPALGGGAARPGSGSGPPSRSGVRRWKPGGWRGAGARRRLKTAENPGPGRETRLRGAGRALLPLRKGFPAPAAGN